MKKTENSSDRKVIRNYVLPSGEFNNKPNTYTHST